MTAIANIGAVITLEMIDATTVAPSLIGVAMAPRTNPIAITITRTTRSARNTDQASPRTRRQLRAKASIGPAPSATIAGAPTDQKVIRIRPGTISRMKPIVTPIPNRIENTISGRIAGAAAENRSPTV